MQSAALTTVAAATTSYHPHHYANLRPLRISEVKAFLEAHEFNILHTTGLKKPIPPLAALLYNNHHAGCLFKFVHGGGVVIDPLDGGSEPSSMHSWKEAGEDDSPALWLYAKKRVGHAFPGGRSRRSGGGGVYDGDRTLYSFPLLHSPLQSQTSSVCMWIAIGILLAYRWTSRHQTQVSVGRLQRLVSFLRKKKRISDALIQHARKKTAPYIR